MIDTKKGFDHIPKEGRRRRTLGIEVRMTKNTIIIIISSKQQKQQ